MWTKKYYERMFRQRPVTQYDFADDTRKSLASIGRDGKKSNSIPIKPTACIWGLTENEYLLKMHQEGRLCGQAEHEVEQSTGKENQ